MGRKGKEIVAEVRDEVVQMLKRAYADEMLAFHFYWYISIYMRGLAPVTVADTFKGFATDELKRAELIADRLNQLGEYAFSDPAEWLKNTNIGTIEPTEYLTYKKAVEKAMEIEGIVIEHYNKIMQKVHGKDFVTYELINDLLAEEVKEEQELEDMLTQLEIN